MDFKDRLDAIWGRITNPVFLENKGRSNEVRYYLFDYEPQYELAVLRKIADLKKRNHPDADGFQIVEYDIYALVMDILEKRGYVDKCVRFEQERGHAYLFNAIAKLLRLTTEQNLIVQHIVENTPDNAVVFLTGIGKIYPIVRAHNILNNLNQVFDKVPVIMFYPGVWDMQSLSLFGSVKDGNYYQAYPLIQ